MDATITHQINTNILKKKWSKQTQLKILKFKFKWASGFFRENFLSTYLYCKVPNVCCYGYQIRTKMRNLLIRTTHTSSLPSAFFIQMAQCLLWSWVYFTFQSTKTYYHRYFFKPLKYDSSYIKIQILQWSLMEHFLHILTN